MNASELLDEAEDTGESSCSRYRVRLRNPDGSRSRTLYIAAVGEDDAAGQALGEACEAGEDWEVLEVKRLGEVDSDRVPPGSSDAEDELDDVLTVPSIRSSSDADQDLPAPQLHNQTRMGRWDPARASTVDLSHDSTSPIKGTPPINDDATEVASFDSELEDLLPMSPSRPPASVPSQVIETRANSESGYRVRIARSSAAIVWEARIETESMEAALEQTRDGLDESWEVLSVSKEGDGTS